MKNPIHKLYQYLFKRPSYILMENVDREIDIEKYFLFEVNNEEIKEFEKNEKIYHYYSDKIREYFIPILPKQNLKKYKKIFKLYEYYSLEKLIDVVLNNLWINFPISESIINKYPHLDNVKIFFQIEPQISNLINLHYQHISNNMGSMFHTVHILKTSADEYYCCDSVIEKKDFFVIYDRI